MNKDRYSDLAWFDDIENAAQRSINQASWTKPAPRRETKQSSILGQLVKLLFR